MVSGPEPSLLEYLAVVVSHGLRNDDVCFTGLTTGGPTALYGTFVPLAGMALAQRFHAPDLTILLAGWCQNPDVGSLKGVPTSEFGSELLDIACEGRSTDYPWNFSIKRGDVTVGFSTGAQVDRFGNLNSVCIGGYDHPDVRLVGPILQPEHMTLFGREIIMMPRHDRRTFVEAVDFVSGLGFPNGRAGRRALGHDNEGPSLIITPLCVYDFDAEGVIRVASIHPGVAARDIREATGFEVGNLDAARATPAPSPEELAVLRADIDPGGLLRR